MLNAYVHRCIAGTIPQRKWGDFRDMQSPWSPALAVILLYGIWLASAVYTGHTARDFEWLGSRFVHRSHASALIRTQRVQPYETGYDGQFYYFMALDPANARYYVDQPSYRYTRIVYPITARFLGLQRSDWIPYALILVNWLAISAGTLAVAAWLKRAGSSPWLAVAFGLSPGLFIALQRDLSEALAYALVAAGVYAADYGGRHRLVVAAVCFALAVLTRETTAVFPLSYGASMLSRDERLGSHHAARGAHWGRMALFLSACLMPIVVYKVFLAIWTGSSGLLAHLYPDILPFGNILTYWPWRAQHIEEAVSIVLPALIWLWMSYRAVRQRLSTVAVWCLAANITLFVVTLNHDSLSNIIASGRIAMGVPLALLYSLPALDRLTGGDRRWLWASFALWLSPCPSLWVFWHHRPIVIDLIALPLAYLAYGIAHGGRVQMYTGQRRTIPLPFS